MDTWLPRMWEALTAVPWWVGAAWVVGCFYARALDRMRAQLDAIQAELEELAGLVAEERTARRAGRGRDAR